MRIQLGAERSPAFARLARLARLARRLFGVLLVGFGLWVSYGVARDDLPLVVPNSVAFLVMGCTIAVVSPHTVRA
jgi:hypothetical protein